MISNRNLRVFVMEDHKSNQQKIEKALKKLNYKVFFFSKDESVFELLKFNPDILIQDYATKKMIKCHEWPVDFH
jgi:PleD family two-component response regulator